jgi:hypothetical protein
MSEEKYSEDWLNNRIERNKRARVPHNALKYWIFSMKDGEHITNCGYELSEESANQRAYEFHLEPFEIMKSHTISVSRAQSEAKGKIFQQTKNLDLALEKMKRKV